MFIAISTLSPIMELCEHAECCQEAVGYLSLGGIRTYYCREHLKRVKRELVGI